MSQNEAIITVENAYRIENGDMSKEEFEGTLAKIRNIIEESISNEPSLSQLTKNKNFKVKNLGNIIKITFDEI